MNTDWKCYRQACQSKLNGVGLFILALIRCDCDWLIKEYALLCWTQLQREIIHHHPNTYEASRMSFNASPKVCQMRTDCYFCALLTIAARTAV